MRSVRARFHKLATVAAAKAEARGFDSLDEKEIVIHCISQLDAQLSAGGFKAYLWDPSGDRAAETVAALNRIGATETARLLARALEIFPSFAPPEHPLIRQQSIMKAGQRSLDALKSLDHQYVQCEEDLQALAVAYVLSLPD